MMTVMMSSMNGKFKRHNPMSLMNQSQQARVPFSAAFVALFLAGCGGATMMNLTMNADTNKLNTCGGTDSHSVVVCVYQLKGDVNFRNASNEKFWRDDTGVLKDDLLEKKQVTLHPGDSQPVRLELKEATKYIGIAADFCKPGKENWRHLYSLSSGNGDLVVSVRDDKLAIEKK